MLASVSVVFVVHHGSQFVLRLALQFFHHVPLIAIQVLACLPIIPQAVLYVIASLPLNVLPLQHLVMLGL